MPPPTPDLHRALRGPAAPGFILAGGRSSRFGAEKACHPVEGIPMALRVAAAMRGAGAAPIGCRDFAMDAWNSRATANRLIHWAVAGSILGLGGDDPDATWLGRQIAVAGLFLRDNLELDLLGNHLFRDAGELVGEDEPHGVAEQVVAEQVELGVYIRFIHRPLSRYLNALAEHGLVLERMVEPAPPAGFLERAPEYPDAATIPRLLYLRLRRT